MNLSNINRGLLLVLFFGAPCFAINMENTELTAQVPINVPTTIPPQLEALEKASAALVHNSKELIQPELISYKEELMDNKGNKLIRYYDASLPPDQRWQQLEVIGKNISQSQLQIDIPLVLSPTLLTQGEPDFYGENDQNWIFAIKSSVNAQNEGQESVELMEANSKLQSYLKTFVHIDKKTQKFTRLEIVNTKPFKPSTLAKIEIFSIVVDYAQVWPAGPLVAKHSVRTLKGSYGLFIGIDEKITQQLSQFSI